MHNWTESDWDRLAMLFEGIPGDDYDANVPLAPYPGYKPETVEAPAGDTKPCDDCHGSGQCWIYEDATCKCGTCGGTGRVPNVDAAGVCTLSDGKTLVHGCRYRCPCGWVFDGTYWPPPRSHQAPGKRYLHVALKYGPPTWAVDYLARAHWEACRVATALGVPAAYRPHESDGTLRVIDYPPGAGTVEHTDANLFTIVLWRSHPADLERHPGEHKDWAKIVGTSRDAAEAMSPGLHIGEIGELVGLGPATPHRVPARPYRQRSLVYFAVPDHAARLPCKGAPYCGSDCVTQTVGEYLADWKRRSRVAAAGAY